MWVDDNVTSNAEVQSTQRCLQYKGQGGGGFKTAQVHTRHTEVKTLYTDISYVGWFGVGASSCQRGARRLYSAG